MRGDLNDGKCQQRRLDGAERESAGFKARRLRALAPDFFCLSTLGSTRFTRNNSVAARSWMNLQGQDLLWFDM